MPTSGANVRFQDAQHTANDEKSANNSFIESLPKTSNIFPASSVTVPLDNSGGSDNNSSAPQVLVKDDEHDLIELMIASSAIPATPLSNANSVKTKSDKGSGCVGGSSRSDAKKRAKQQRDLSRDLALLWPESSKLQEEKAFSFAQAYFLKVRDRLDEKSFMEFVNVLSSFDNQSMTVCDLYHKAISILELYSELAEEFVAFLLPEQAMELGVYMEYLCFTKMRHFLQKLEVYFNKQPQQVRKVYECLSRLADQSAANKIDMSTVRSVILPLLKGSSLLTEYFLLMFPNEQPPVLECSDNKDFEKVDCGEFDESSSGVQQQDVDAWDWETVDIPDMDDPYGGENCPCTCHYNSVSSASVHCFSCGIKFINGRVFVQNGKVLRPAKLVIEGVNKKEIIERIGKKPVSKNGDVSKNEIVGSLRHRKRPAADSSVKNSTGTSSCGSSGNSSLLSPTGTVSESEEDISDFKQPAAKVKSPRNIKSGCIVKGSHNKMVMNKDTEVESPLLTENQLLNTHTYVLLDNLSTGNGIEKNSKDGSQEGISGDVIKRESCDTEEPCFQKKLEVGEYEGAVPTISSQTSNCVDSMELRDDEDDDVEFIEIDDDDADDDVDVIEDDDDDDDIEEDEEEIVHNYDEEEDYEDIEVVEIDEDEERDMDVDYLMDNKEGENNCHDGSRTDKNVGSNSLCNKESIISDGSDAIKSNTSERAVKSVKHENSEQILIQDIKVEIESDTCNNECDVVDLKSSSTDDKLPANEFHVPTCDQPETVIDTVSLPDVKESDESSLNSLAPSLLPSPSQLSASISSATSWTKEEDKVILQTIQQEGDTDENFVMIRKQLSQRSVEEIKSRFNMLMQLLKRMTTNKNSIEEK